MRADEYFPFLLFFNSATFAFQASFKAFSFLENPFLESSFETFMISMESQQVGCKTGKAKMSNPYVTQIPHISSNKA